MTCLSGLMLTLLLIVGATGLLSVQAMAIDTMESSAFERGEQIFNSNCAACHMGGGNVIRAKPNAEDQRLERPCGGLLQLPAGGPGA